MSAVNITNVTVLDNPASFLTPFQFEISYECVSSLKEDQVHKFKEAKSDYGTSTSQDTCD